MTIFGQLIGGALYQLATALVCLLAVWFFGVLAWWLVFGHYTAETMDTTTAGTETGADDDA